MGPYYALLWDVQEIVRGVGEAFHTFHSFLAKGTITRVLVQKAPPPAIFVHA
jgi:hypothetical protein